MSAIVDFGFIILLVIAAFFMSRIDASERAELKRVRGLKKLTETNEGNFRA